MSKYEVVMDFWLFWLFWLIFMFLFVMVFVVGERVKRGCDEVARAIDMLDRLDFHSSIAYIGVVTAKAYTNCPTETDGDPNITAFGKRVSQGIIAISRDLEEYIVEGDRVWVKELNQFFVVGDRTHKSRYRQIEIYMSKEEKPEAIKFGKRKVHLYYYSGKKTPSKL